MPVLIGIALKSLLIAGIALGLLRLMKARSPAERSCVAHIGLLALVVMAVAPVVLPRWTVEVPAMAAAPVEVSTTAAPSIAAPTPDAPLATTPHQAVSASTVAPADRAFNPLTIALATYAIPAAILLFVTFLALARLIALRARAEVLVDGHWLSALARAQRRMGFKHGTALLTSNDLASPISWGLMRPVILLSNRAVEATDEAEAIIAHELAHVARMDWIKLLLARFATALFWFNPLVWILAREAHQLREEAADDSVLAANIADTDYAQLLVGVARHECPGLLLGAHGVAPSKSSLARRVARVLDGKLVRRPAARPFTLGVFVGAIALATPLAALTMTQTTGSRGKSAVAPTAAGVERLYVESAEVPTDLPRLIARGVSTSVATASAAIAPTIAVATVSPPKIAPIAPQAIAAVAGITVARAPNGSTVTVYPPDAQGRVKTVARAANGAVAISYADADDASDRAADRAAERQRDREQDRRRDDPIQTAIEMKALSVTPEYVAAMRSASPGLRTATLDDIIEMRAVGVTPEYARQVANAGFANLDSDDLVQARSVGVTPDYMRAIRATGIRPSLDELIQLKSMGITAEELSRVRGSGALDRRKLMQLVAPPAPPQPPGVGGE